MTAEMSARINKARNQKEPEMNAPAIIPFNADAAYQREREYSRKLEATLSKALMLLGLECKRRELRGEDVAHIRQFVRESEL